MVQEYSTGSPQAINGYHGSATEGSEIGRANFVRTSFGDAAAVPSSAERFTGKPYDADLGAHVFPYRNYRADLGRWMSAGPINFPDGPNQRFYAPVPTMGVDPWGLSYDVTQSISGSAYWIVTASFPFFTIGPTLIVTQTRDLLSGWNLPTWQIDVLATNYNGSMIYPYSQVLHISNFDLTQTGGDLTEHHFIDTITIELDYFNVFQFAYDHHEIAINYRYTIEWKEI